MAVGDDGALYSESESRLLRKTGIGQHAQSDYAHVCGEVPARGVHRDLFSAVYRSHARRKPELHAVFSQFGMKKARHVVIDLRQHLSAALNERYLYAARDKIFRRLQSYESAASDYRRCRPARLYVVVYGKRVLDGAQGKTSLSPAALRHDGSCAGAVYQLVVALGIPLTARKHGHPLCCAVYPDDFAVHADVDVEAPSETFGRLQRERRTALYFPADIVRQPAVGI